MKSRPNCNQSIRVRVLEQEHNCEMIIVKRGLKIYRTVKSRFKDQNPISISSTERWRIISDRLVIDFEGFMDHNSFDLMSLSFGVRIISQFAKNFCRIESKTRLLTRGFDLIWEISFAFLPFLLLAFTRDLL